MLHGRNQPLHIQWMEKFLFTRFLHDLCHTEAVKIVASHFFLRICHFAYFSQKKKQSLVRENVSERVFGGIIGKSEKNCHLYHAFFAKLKLHRYL